jgi:hypothetical protein
MTNGKCDYCGMKFEDGDEFLLYTYDSGELQFCYGGCAGEWFAQNECETAIYHDGDD